MTEILNGGKVVCCYNRINIFWRHMNVHNFIPWSSINIFFPISSSPDFLHLPLKYWVPPTVGRWIMSKIDQESHPVLKGFFYPSTFPIMPTFLQLCHAHVLHVYILVPVVYIGKQEQRKRRISHRIHQEQRCDLSRAKISISYLLDHIIYCFGVISANSPPFRCLRRAVVLAGPSQKSKVLRNDCRSTVGFILWQELNESMAPARLAQSRSLWGISSTFSAWKEGTLLCNICCCLLTAVLQHVFHTPSQKSIPGWCVWGVVTFFSCLYELWVSGRWCCYELLRKVLEEEGEELFGLFFFFLKKQNPDLVLYRSGNIILSWDEWETHAPRQTSSSSHRADSRVWLTLDPISPEERSMKRESPASWKLWGSTCGERRSWVTLSLSWKGCRMGVTTSFMGQLLSGNWCQEELVIPSLKKQ